MVQYTNQPTWVETMMNTPKLMSFWLNVGKVVTRNPFRTVLWYNSQWKVDQYFCGTGTNHPTGLQSHCSLVLQLFRFLAWTSIITTILLGYPSRPNSRRLWWLKVRSAATEFTFYQHSQDSKWALFIWSHPQKMVGFIPSLLPISLTNRLNHPFSSQSHNISIIIMDHWLNPHYYGYARNSFAFWV